MTAIAGHIARKSPAPKTYPRSFNRLSTQLNETGDGFEITRKVAEGIASLLDVPAVIVAQFEPYEVMFVHHRFYSYDIAQIEQALRSKRQKFIEQIPWTKQRTLVSDKGLLYLQIRWHSRTVAIVAIDTLGKRITSIQRAGLISLSHQLGALFGLQTEVADAATPVRIEKQELERAAIVQEGLQSLVPEPACGLDIAAYTRPAEYVGGDYYDLLSLDNRKLGIVVADVEGKGVSGALFGNLLRTTVHFLARESSSAAEMVRNINSILHKQSAAAHKLFTMFYCVYDPQTKELEFAGSGHVYPFLARAAGTIERLPSDGPVLGIDTGKHIHQQRIQLYTNDLIAFHTDGLVEQRNTLDEPFGDNRVIDLINNCRGRGVQTILQSIMQAHADFYTTHPADDTTLLLAQVK